MPRIEKFGKKGAFYQAVLEDGRVIKIHPETAVEFSLAAGRKFDDDRWSGIDRLNSFRLARDAAMRMLSIRAHCLKDLGNKLRTRGFGKCAVDDVLAECERLGLIDDAKFAEEYVRELRDGGAGTNLIRMKLRRKGVPEELIRRELEENASVEEELKAARIAMRKKERSLAREKDPLKRREKLYRHLVSKGFQYHIIERVCGDCD